MEVSQRIVSGSEDEPTECNVLLSSSTNGESKVKASVLPDKCVHTFVKITLLPIFC